MCYILFTLCLRINFASCSFNLLKQTLCQGKKRSKLFFYLKKINVLKNNTIFCTKNRKQHLNILLFE